MASALAFAASSPGVAWEKTYDVQGSDRGWSMQQTADGGFILAGASGSLVCLAKVGADGGLQWKNTYGFGDGAKGYSVRQTSDGGFVVAGSARQGGKDRVLLMKVDQDGQQLWNRTYGDSSPGAIEGAGTSVRQAADGGFVIAAQYPYPTTGNCGLYLLRTDASGNLSQSVMIGKSGDVTSPSVEQTADGGYIMAATLHTKGYQGIDPDYDIYLIKFTPSGSTQWEKTIGGSGSQYCGRDGSVKQARDGGFVIAGENGGAYLAKTDSSGNLLWGKSYNDSARAGSVALADDGGYVLTGTDNSGRLIIIKTDSNGNEEWRQASGAGSCEAATVQKTADGGYAASGSSGGDLLLVVLNAPVKTSSSPGLNSGGLFSGLDLFRLGSAGDASTDLGQAAPVDNGLFDSSFKMFNLFGDSSLQSTPVNSPLKFSSMPSLGFKNTGPSLMSPGFPRLAASFGGAGWPFSS